MKKSRTIQLTWVTVSLMVLNSCHKKIDKLPDGSSLCKVVTLTTDGSYIPNTDHRLDTFHITYNSHEDPAVITRLRPTTSLPDWVFRYDHAQRMTDLLGVYDLPVVNGATYDTWRKFYYANNRIVLDTVFDFGNINGDRPMSFFPDQALPTIRQISAYEYDAKGRMSRAAETHFIGACNNNCTFLVDNLFSYNSSGNLDKITIVDNNPYINGPDTSYIVLSGYDNKINPERTHPIWQFLDRNYSENNNFHADQYNEAGLPTVATQPETLPLQSGYPWTFGFVVGVLRPWTIEYSCCQPPNGNGGHGY